MNKKRLLLLLLLFSMLGLLFAQSLESVLPQLSSTQINTLKKGELLKGASFNNNVRELVPNDSIVQRHLLEALTTSDSFTVVSTILIPYPKKIEHLSSSEKQLIIYNTMRRISTQEGITYISHRAGDKPKTLIEKSWYLETPKSRTGLEDPVSTFVPKTSEYFVYQRDSSFGSNIYRHRYTTDDNEIFVKVENLETMRVFSIFKAVATEQLAIAMSTYQTDEGLILVATATISGRAPTVKVLGISVDLPSAFTRRTTALGEWFVDQLNR